MAAGHLDALARALGGEQQPQSPEPGGIEIVLFAGGLTFFGYLIALVVGGDTAAAICTFIYKSFIPLIIKASTILILFGLLAMYLAGEKALAPDKHSVKKIVKE